MDNPTGTVRSTPNLRKPTTTSEGTQHNTTSREQKQLQKIPERSRKYNNYDALLEIYKNLGSQQKGTYFP